MTEFELIARYFAVPAAERARAATASWARGTTSATSTTSTTGRTGAGDRVALGIGDDCALLTPRPGRVLAVSTDMLVEGRHYFHDVDPAALGWKALAVNLSDLAAMGAAPLGFTLALALPDANDDWLAAFSRGLFDCADAFDCPLVGGDTTRGPANVCITILGDVEAAGALRRDGAVVGDDLWVSGTLGGAALALRGLLARRAGGTEPVDATLIRALERPVPRLSLGRALVGVAHAAIDVSDGLLQDLSHVLVASRCGACVAIDALPLAAALRAADGADDYRLALSGGDDYELCFTAPPARRDDVLTAGAATGTPVVRIGRVTARDAGAAPVRLVDGDGAEWRPADGAVRSHGFDHFA